MALFVAFIAGAFMQLRGSMILSKRLLSHRRASLKKTVHVQMSSDGIAYSKTATEWHAAWEEVRDVTVISTAAFFWLSDTGFLVPLRAIPTRRALGLRRSHKSLVQSALTPPPHRQSGA